MRIASTATRLMAVIAMLLTGLAAAACGAAPVATPTGAPPSATGVSAPTVAPTATTAPAPTSIATTAGPAATAGRAGASPVVFVRKFALSANGLSPRGSRNVQNLAVDAAGNVYVLVGEQQVEVQLQKYDAEGRFVTSWGGEGSEDGQFRLWSARHQLRSGHLGVDRAGTIWVADTFNYRLQRFDPTGKLLAKFGGRDSEGGEFSGPLRFALDGEDNFYIGDFNGRVLKFDPTGRLLTTLAKPGSTEGEFLRPLVGAVDEGGNIYVADPQATRVTKLDRDGKLLTSWGGQGSGDGQFQRPYIVARDPQGNLYVSDFSKRIQKFDANGKFLGQWGDPGDGEPPFANAIGPAMTVDTRGDVYLATLEDNTIYVFRPR